MKRKAAIIVNVASWGSDENDGSYEKPARTVKRATEILSSLPPLDGRMRDRDLIEIWGSENPQEDSMAIIKGGK